MGLFMPDQAVETVIGQCRAFLEMGNGNYLYSTFADRVMELNTLTEKEKSDYIQENALAISDYVFPAYERMTEELEQPKGSGKNEKVLYISEGEGILRTSCPAVNRFKTFGRGTKRFDTQTDKRRSYGDGASARSDNKGS